MVFELTLWTPYMTKTVDSFRETDQFPDWRFDSTQVRVFGTKGMMFAARHGDGWKVFDTDHKEVASGNGPFPEPQHIDNFLACVESRKTPNADIEQGHLSTNLCHLGNIAYRLSGRKLHWDGKAEKFINDDEANKLLKRAGREPWVIPETV